MRTNSSDHLGRWWSAGRQSVGPDCGVRSGGKAEEDCKVGRGVRVEEGKRARRGSQRSEVGIVTDKSVIPRHVSCYAATCAPPTGLAVCSGARREKPPPPLQPPLHSLPLPPLPSLARYTFHCPLPPPYSLGLPKQHHPYPLLWQRRPLARDVHSQDCHTQCSARRRLGEVEGREGEECLYRKGRRGGEPLAMPVSAFAAGALASLTARPSSYPIKPSAPFITHPHHNTPASIPWPHYPTHSLPRSAHLGFSQPRRPTSLYTLAPPITSEPGKAPRFDGCLRGRGREAECEEVGFKKTPPRQKGDESF